MLALAYWNVYKGRGTHVAAAIADLAADICADPSLSGPQKEVLLCLSEPGKIDFAAVLSDLNSRNLGMTWSLTFHSSKRFVFLSTLQSTAWQPSLSLAVGSLGSDLYRTTTAGVPVSYQIWFVHLAAPIFVWNPSALALDEAGELRKAIETREADMGHANTVAIGDFNMEPFSDPMVAPTGLNACSCKTVAASGHKNLSRGRRVQYFFNPMWALLGCWDLSRQPGSFFQADRTVSVHWHLIDQVLVRPGMVASLCAGTPKILAKVGSSSLVTPAGKIGQVSDHLPVVVSLSI